MIYLSANSENVIYTSVSVHKTMSKPTYLMSLTHQQTGKRWSFIPQNISSYYGAPYNSRYDIFKFDISGGTENLTGGTLGWYWQTPPYYVNNNDVRYTETGLSYLQQRSIIPGVLGSLTWYYDFDNTTESITGATVTLDGVVLPVTTISYQANTNIWFVITNLQGANIQLNGLLEIEATTDLGRTLTSSYYVTSMGNVAAVEPWKLYGDNIVDPDRSYPITHIDTPSINIDEIGEFSYTIREQVNPINLNTQYTTETLETGLAYIYQGFTDIYYDKGGDSVVYNPDNI